MSDFDDMGRKTSQKARETAERGRHAAEDAARSVDRSYSAAFENMQHLNVKLIDAMQANAEALCAFARDIAAVKAPPELLSVWMDHAQKQFEMVTKQANDFTALGQRLASESTGPMTRSFQQAFTQATT